MQTSSEYQQSTVRFIFILRFYTTGREEWRGIPDVDKPNSYIEKWPADEDGKITISWTYLDKVKAGSSGYSTSEGKKLKEWMSELTGDIGCIK